MSSMALSTMSPAANAAKATTGASSSSTADTSNPITSSDFMTLLVTEMKNQDPTQPTDPNAYIQQLVGVNSLQQLISINQDLTGIGTSTSTSGVATPGVASVSGS
jgi:flagellar basal-body rod modification protein FlgD